MQLFGDGADVTGMLPYPCSSPPRLGQNNEVTGTACYPHNDDYIDMDDTQNATGSSCTPPSSTACASGVATKETYDDNSEFDQQIVTSLGCISTQRIAHKSGNTNRKSAISAVSLNECVYNLEEWDGEEFGCFVVPTDNVEDAVVADESPGALSCEEPDVQSRSASPPCLFTLASHLPLSQKDDGDTTPTAGGGVMRLAGFPSSPRLLHKGVGSSMSRLSVGSISSTDRKSVV